MLVLSLMMNEDSPYNVIHTYKKSKLYNEHEMSKGNHSGGFDCWKKKFAQILQPMRNSDSLND